jgi:hypothetical protein
MNHDLTELLERIETFEQRLSVTMEGLFAVMDDNEFVSINGELFC